MEQKKKILAVVGATYVFGAEKVALDTIDGLVDEGYDVHCMVSGWNDGDFIKRLSEKGIKYTAIKLGWFFISKIMWVLDSLINYPKAIIGFIKLKKKFKPDLVYIISFRQIIMLYPFFNKNIIYHLHNENSKRMIDRFFIRLIDNKILKYIAVSNFIKKDIINCGINAQKVEVIYNGVSVPNIIGQNRTQSDILKIGIIGQVIPRKGHSIAIEALRYVNEQNQNVKLVIVGSGDKNFETTLKEKIDEYQLSNSVEWRGFLKNIEDIYKDIDVVLAPTLDEEPFGLIAVEANMLGIPAIVSNKGGLSEIIENEVNGFTFNSENPKELAEIILHFLKNRELLKTMGDKGREIANNSFSKSIMNKKINGLLNDLYLN